MKKRILSIVLALTLILCASVPALAEGQTVTQGDTLPVEKEIVLSYTVTQKFTVTIPEAINVTDGETKSGTEIGTGTVTVAAGMLLDFGTELNVKIRGANFNNTDKYRLKNGDNDNYLKYSITYGSDPETPVTANDAEILSVDAGRTEGGSVELTYKLAQAVTISGTYTDTLTFTVAVIDTPTQS